MKRRVVVLGLIFLVFLILAYFENNLFLGYIGKIFAHPILTITVIFFHNVIASSLIVLGMNFYIEFTRILPRATYKEYMVLEKPRLFSAIFTIFIMAMSIFRIVAFLNGGLAYGMVVSIIAAALPHSFIEAYSIYNAIYKVLTKRLTIKALAAIYLLLLSAAVLEVISMQALSLFKIPVSNPTV
ncbi:MAG: hypothetical protein QXQ29_06595 [Candidatus Bathyarchaeia archaeon]